MSPHGDTVVGGKEHVGVVEFPQFLELVEDTAHLDVDVLDAGVFTSEFVANRAFVAILPHAADIHFITHTHVGVVERMAGKIIDR